MSGSLALGLLAPQRASSRASNMTQQSKPAMIQRYELERQVIAALMMTPSLIESSEILNTATFSTEKFKKIFAYIAEKWENGRPEIIDEVLLAEAVGIPLVEVAQITVGCYRPQPEAFAIWVRKLEVRRLAERNLKLSGNESAALLKTGEVDLAKIAEMMENWQEIQGLDRPTQGPAFKCLNDVEGRSISWLWAGRIPLGMLTLLVGDPGLGKSFLATWISSRLSVGGPLPGDPGPALSGSTIYLSAEDSPTYALRPRAGKNGADLSKIIVLEDSAFDIRADIKKIRAIVEKDSSVRLLIIDPLNSYLGGADYFKDSAVRVMLNPLVQFLEETQIACKAVMHLNKKTDQAGIYRIGGSIAFAGVARSILAVTRDPEDHDRRFLRPVKMNYARKPEALAFRIGDDLALTFDEGAVDVGSDESLSPLTGREAGEGTFAQEWLAEQLSAGPLNLKDILASAREGRISRSAIFRARGKLKLKVRTFGFGRERASNWELPDE